MKRGRWSKKKWSVRWQAMCTDDSGEWRNVLVGQGETITNLNLSGTPVFFRLRHWSRNIGLHLLATTILPCFLLFLLWCQSFKRTSAAHFLILPYLYFSLLTPLPGQGLDFALTQTWGKRAEVRNKILIVICWCDLWLLELSRSVCLPQVHLSNNTGQQRVCNFMVSDALLIVQVHCWKSKWQQVRGSIYRSVCHPGIASACPTIVYVTSLLIPEKLHQWEELLGRGHNAGCGAL